MSDERADQVVKAAETEGAEVVGVRCPKCACAHCPVQYTRHRLGGRIVRGRECRHCGKKFNTTERVNGGGGG